MNELDKQFLSSMVFAIAGICVKWLDNKEPKPGTSTACVMCPFAGSYYIRYNVKQVKEISNHLVMVRGFDARYVPMEVLLHEICHYKQLMKFRKNKKFLIGIRWYFELKKSREYNEKVADRYAHYCTKIIVRRIKLWEAWNSILESNF